MYTKKSAIFLHHIFSNQQRKKFNSKCKVIRQIRQIKICRSELCSKFQSKCQQVFCAILKEISMFFCLLFFKDLFFERQSMSMRGAEGEGVKQTPQC